jgi:hypothetical protein
MFLRGIFNDSSFLGERMLFNANLCAIGGLDPICLLSKYDDVEDLSDIVNQIVGA